MGKNYFTPEQVEELRKNKYVKNVSDKAITYTEEFKEVFLLEYNEGKLPSQILTGMGFDYKVLGGRRVSNITQAVKNNHFVQKVLRTLEMIIQIWGDLALKI